MLTKALTNSNQENDDLKAAETSVKLLELNRLLINFTSAFKWEMRGMQEAAKKEGKREEAGGGAWDGFGKKRDEMA